jgi:hypothetical protein
MEQQHHFDTAVLVALNWHQQAPQSVTLGKLNDNKSVFLYNLPAVIHQ